MKVKLILPALAEAESPFWRPIKYSLFPPLGLATLAAYLSPDDEVDLQDQHVEVLHLDDHPDLVNKVSPVIARIFSPLVLVMLVIYLFAILYSGKNPYSDREFLIIFNLL
ncbi:hypothetical protein ACSX1A_02465 [Pontibacter sp. MBLB2868]|uniref:hypothetical protein n=1 Tax=Pontibacter sp. MBLB2868 TaxID=3451555 RepID=UPI003F74B23A